MGKMIEKINANRLFEKAEKTDKLSVRLTREKWTQITKSGTRGDIISDLSEIKRVLREYYEQS